MIEKLRARYFFLGVILGFLVCCLSGYEISKKARFAHFHRTFNAISPTMQYYPAVEEFLNTAKRHVNPEKVLVLVGGSSVLRGAGQNPEEVWSNELQRLLGEQYTVLNYAVDGGGITTVGAVVFRILNEKYKKIIFVTSAPAGGNGDVDGIDPYRYFFWDAYYKHLYHPDEIEYDLIRQTQKSQMKTAQGLENHLLSYLDSRFYFRNLWNWVAYRLAFTVWAEPANTDAAYRRYFGPRRRYREESHPDMFAIRERVRNDEKRSESELKASREVVEYFASLDENRPKLRLNKFIVGKERYGESFSPRYRSKILCVILSENPHYVSLLSKKAQKAHALIMQRTQDDLISLGYHTIMAGQTFLPDDYFDGNHLFVTGGNKLAAAVAKEVRKIAIDNHYI